MAINPKILFNVATYSSILMTFIFCDLSFSQTTPNSASTQPNRSGATTTSANGVGSNQFQPQIRIDAQQLINSQNQNQKQEKKPPPNPNRDYTGTAPNNTRIGSNGDYIDNSSSEQITSSGLICKSDRNSKKCN